MSNNGNQPWILIVATDVDTYLAGPYAAALSNAALAAGQPDPFTAVMTDVVTEIRSAIRGGCLKNQTPIVVSQTPLSIPPDLKRHAMALIIEALAGRLAKAGVKLGKEAIKEAGDNARRYIERIQEGKATVTAPPDPMAPDDQEKGGPTQVVRGDRRLFSRRTLRGL
jgi:hypothetical protein